MARTRTLAEMRADVPREDGTGVDRLLSSVVYERGEHQGVPIL